MTSLLALTSRFIGTGPIGYMDTGTAYTALAYRKPRLKHVQSW